jgi:glycosyltransferase involved in cell wall biosynthesis
MEKKKILVIADHPMAFSGVANQTRYVIDALVKTGKYKFVCLGGAMKHHDYRPVKVDEWGEDVIIFPVDGYGSPDIIRSIIRTERPDLLWFMTDPRFWDWLWQMEDEIRPLIPMVYYHVWDNYPYPKYNKTDYSSNDFIAAISKVTHDIVKTVTPEVKSQYLPHAVDQSIFKKLPDEEIQEQKKLHFGEIATNKKIFFFNSRNARRKMTGSLILWFKEFIDEVGHDKAILLMHTDPKDPNGPDLEAIINDNNLNEGQVLFSKEKLAPENMAAIYNMVDCTISISDAEGFGLSTLESLACGTPIIVTMTGGLQEQVTDGKEWFGIGIEPISKAIIGSQQVPYIYEDRICKEDFKNALKKIYSMSSDELDEMTKKGIKHVEKNYNFENFKSSWVKLIEEVIQENGSWKTRKNYKSWNFKEIR